ncbi:iron chelate uptake ABC transporter family permease subunit [Streptomyces goshikiensis]|uniref:Iron chelate uptake ABC transporter family permease subunit n=1 Tax=Streptomyces goshikiensis TaxID=1942 RepID=A0ABZ1RWZ4_9ACTN|nr:MULTISPECIES: iron chelate uptake ABC transporter family permease subunit [Streptomyces]AKL69890.1 membrane protein [Streptomyces sp. Mg1]MBP0933615.1 iron chelate uptake ABC transporter family permease subunit [Streptomyces sp. KCTC 0041BP]WBY24010.1 iron chelate uptake ABC transporter family permease subunit [Streptomyces goshikiensis]WSY02466.1 iron chelate uptake ABC transporter family permease subunit [Streptomyces goshikiensis]
MPTKLRAGRPAGPRPLRIPGGISLRLERRALAVGLLLAVTALALAVVLIGTGDFQIAPADVVQTLLGNGTPANDFIVNDLRLPRVLVALLVGASLGMSGAVFQSVSRNPLGSPDLLGFGYGSAVGALVVIIVFKGGATEVALGALVGGLIAGLAVYLLAYKRGINGYRLVLVGIGASAMLVAVIQYLLTKAQLVEATRAMVWLTGSLAGRDWGQVWPLLAACAVLFPLVLGQGRALRMMEMGDDAAHALGVRVERTRLLLMVAGILLTTAASAAAGPISFVALAAPQLARRLTRSPGAGLLTAALMGAVLLMLSDWASQRAFGADQLPVGVVTGLVGGVYLLWLLVTERKAGRI